MIIVVTFAWVAGLLVLLSAPLFVLAWQRERLITARNFLATAGVIALFAGFMVHNSERQIEQCRAAGNPSCWDSGTAGLMIVFIGTYAVVSWVVAWNIWRE